MNQDPLREGDGTELVLKIQRPLGSSAIDYQARMYGRWAAESYAKRFRITCPIEQAWLTLAIIAIAADMIRERRI